VAAHLEPKSNEASHTLTWNRKKEEEESMQSQKMPET